MAPAFGVFGRDDFAPWRELLSIRSVNFYYRYGSPADLTRVRRSVGPLLAAPHPMHDWRRAAQAAELLMLLEIADPVAWGALATGEREVDIGLDPDWRVDGGRPLELTLDASRVGDAHDWMTWLRDSMIMLFSQRDDDDDAAFQAARAVCVASVSSSLWRIVRAD
ncbi:hypothetical protein PINS_up009050 [Pythium insidiosum]|nr:hypothetical protein PINS_up009050 [Pythium insidiosum]